MIDRMSGRFDFSRRKKERTKKSKRKCTLYSLRVEKETGISHLKGRDGRVRYGGHVMR